VTAATLQFDAAVENIAIQEFPNHNDVAATERFNREGKIETKFTQAEWLLDADVKRICLYRIRPASAAIW
jgi:hypothetical protein